MATPLVVNGAVKMATAPTLQPYLENSKVKETKVFISELCRQFHQLSLVSSGTGGSIITIKNHDDSIPNPKPNQLIPMSPSGIQKERMMEGDMCVLASHGSILSTPLAKSHTHKSLKSSDCAPLFLKAECYHYLFNAAVTLHRLGLNRSNPTHSPIKGMNGNVRNSTIPTKARKVVSENGNGPSRRCIVLDIEGTTTPISFVTDVLFPYARENVRRHLDETYDTTETREDIKLLRAQVEEDLEKGIPGAVPIPPDDAKKDDIIAALVTNVEAMIKADQKITSLKQLQGHIWKTGFCNDELEGVVFDDVPEALERWHALGIKVYIYSSGSRLAQRLIFGYTNHGDLRKHLCGFFDTTVGNKKETRSYIEIAESLGVDKPSDILFITDVYPEAIAANAAGLEVMISIRPGNGPLPENHGFKTIKSFSEIEP